MRLLNKLTLRLRSLFRRDAINRELDDELRLHIEREIEQNIAAGMPPDEARYAALREFGGVEQIREECNDMRNVNWLQDFVQDVRYGVRVLAKSPGFALICILTLALGIGANTAIFSVIDATLLRQLPVTDARSLVLLEWTAHKQPKSYDSSSYGDCAQRESPNLVRCSFSEPLFDAIRSESNVFSSLAAFAGSQRLGLSGNGPASTVDDAKYVSGEYFQTLGVRAEAGRLIGAADDSPSASPVAVLGYGYWKSHFGGSPAAIGKTILLNRIPFTIVGVAEPQFDALSPGDAIQMWLPLSSVAQVDLPWDNRDADTNSLWLVIIGRLKPGISRAQAQAALMPLYVNQVTHTAKPLWKSEDAPAMLVVPAQGGLTGKKTDVAAPLYVLMCAVGVVLLIACANVAGLLLSRATARQKEIAVRFALGAGRLRIVRQLLAESVLLSFAGGALGILFARWVVVAITSFFVANREGPSSVNPGIDARVLAFTAGISILTGILFGLAPALRGIRVNLTPALKDASSNLSSAHARGRWFSAANILVVTQVALTIVVLCGAGLLVRTLQNLKTVDPGFDTRNILTFSIDPTLAGYKRADVDSFYMNLQGRLEAIPGVASVSYSSSPLLSGSLWTTGFHLPGTPKDEVAEADMLQVGLDFSRTMKIPLRRGRELNSVDFAAAQRVDQALAEQQERVSASVKNGTKGLAEINKRALANLPPVPVMVNDALVRKYFPKINPIGVRFGRSEVTDTDGNPGWEIVGVVGDARYNSLRREVHPTIYAPASGRRTTFTLRTALDPLSFVPQIRSVVGQMDSNLPIYRIRTETKQIEMQLLTERLIARLSSFFGILALLLACVGLYGLLAFEVSRRTREIGIRMALGAEAGDVLRLVIGQGIALAAVGAVIGVASALGVMRFLGAMLYNVKAADPITFIGVAALLAAVAALACYLPARRATRVDPLVALRYE